MNSQTASPASPDNFLVEDKAGHVWNLEITIWLARYLDKCDLSEVTNNQISWVDPSESDNKAIIETILDSRYKTLSVVFCLVQDQIENNLGINPETNLEEAQEAFYRNFTGLEASNAHFKFWRAWADFCQDHRTVLLTALSERIEMIKMVEENIQEGLPALREKVRAELKGVMDIATKDLRIDPGVTA